MLAEGSQQGPSAVPALGPHGWGLSVLLEGRSHTRQWEEERHELCVRKRKTRFELLQGKQMVEIRGKLADVNDDRAAHSLSTKNMHFSAFAGVRKQ